MKTVIIDNYDSFTYNLAHLVKELGAEVDVLRNDKFELEELEKYDKMSSALTQDGNPYLASAWVNRPSDKHSAGNSPI